MKNKREALVDFYKDLQCNFRGLSQSQRRSLWNTITSKEGEKLVDKLIANPTASIAPARSISFKEWLESAENRRRI